MITLETVGFGILGPFPYCSLVEVVIV